MNASGMLYTCKLYSFCPVGEEAFGVLVSSMREGTDYGVDTFLKAIVLYCL